MATTLPSETKTENMLSRCLRGAILGFAIAVAIDASIFAIVLGIGAITPPSSSNFKTVRFLIDTGALVATIGLLAGIAARIPRHGISILKSIGIVASCAMICAFFQATQPVDKGSPEPSFIPPIIAAFVGCVIVVLFGAEKTYQLKQEELEIKKAQNATEQHTNSKN